MLQDQDLISIQEVRTKVEAAHAAWLNYQKLNQEQVDAVVERMAAAGRAHAQRLAEMAVEETSYGNVKDKLAKNLLCSDLLPRSIRSMKTVGVLREIPEQKVVEIGVPVGVVAAICPTTNPTSTAIYKSIISLKAGNAVVLSPHPRARKCTCYTADLLTKAAVEAGAPDGLIQCLEHSTMEGTNALMKHDKVAVILSTGGAGIVKAAYSSGKPAFGVGPGNVPVLVEKSADVEQAVAQVVAGKSFDYGTVCSSEQSLVTCFANKERVLSALKANKAYLCNAAERDALARLLFTPQGTVSPKCVGQSPGRIAEMAGFKVPPDTSIIAVEIEGIGKFHPLSAEKLSPVLSLYFVEGFEQAMDACEAILRFGGLGHTCVIFSNNEERIRLFALRMPAFRILVNTPAPQGSVGITTGLQPSMTLGCGAMAGNSTSDNVGPLHLINIKRVAAKVREAGQAMPAPEAGAAASAGAGGVDRQTVVAAVEKYLAERGITLSGNAPAAPARAPEPPRPAVSASAIAGVASEVVDRFLASRRSSAPANPAEKAPSCGCATAPAAAAKGSPAPAPEPPAPPVVIVDFVCEADVRTAIQQSRKIFIGPKTIVTPAARELAAPAEVLIVAQRP